MRTVLLVVATLLVLGGAFAGYMILQTPPPASTTATADLPLPARPRDLAPRPAPDAAGGSEAAPQPAQPVAGPATQPATGERVIGAGENVWVKNVDASGRLTNEFRAARYDPRPDDTVDVLRPEARFYVDAESILVLRAERGRIFVPASTGQRETMRDTRAQTPTRGELVDVTLSLHKAIDGPAVLSATMPNIAFDNDTFRISTEPYTDAAGNAVPADAVPVQVRGEEYDFDGYGLVLRWNEMDGRLQALDIARGERLVVKNPEALKLGDIAATPADAEGGEAAAAAAARAPVVVRWSGPVRIAPVSVNRTLLRETYRMRLGDQVRITQADQPLADADQLEVSFTLDRQRQRERRERGEPDDDPPVIVTLAGAPAVVRLQGTEARAASVSYESATGSATLRASPDHPRVAMQDNAGRTIFAQRVEFDGAGNVATLAGPVKFELPIDPAQGAPAEQPPQVMLAEASKECRLAFEKGQSQLAPKSATFIGDVAIDHPQLKLNSQELTLNFAQSPAGAAGRGDAGDLTLAGLAATGGVRARVIDERQQAQSIECAALELATGQDDAGALVARAIRAEGDVRIDSPGQQLSAGAIDATFRPIDPARAPGAAGAAMLSAGPGQELATLLARDGVKLRSADGATIDADRVALSEEAGRRWLTLTGAPARIGDAQGMLSAGQLRFDPDSGDAVIAGGGQFDTVLAAGPEGERPQAEQRPPQPARVTWRNELTFAAAQNQAQADGGVEIVATQPDGTSLRGTAQRLQLAFAAAPDARHGAATTRPTAAPLAGRALDAASLLGDVQLVALRHDDAARPVQRVHLFGQRLDYRPADQTFAVASAGRMLVEDRRSPAVTDAREGPGALGVSTRGATAFQWADKLTFSSQSNRAEMAGDVLVVHRPADRAAAREGDAAGEPPPEDRRDLRLQADTVSAELVAQEPGGETAADPATQVRRVVAGGNVRVETANLEFLADEVEFRPADDVLIARGSDRSPAVLLDDQGLSRGSFIEMWLNTRTQESHLKDFRATVRR